MKKLLFVVFLIMLSTLLISQEKKSGISIGVNSAKWVGDADQFAEDLTKEINSEPGFSGFKFENKARVGFSLAIFIDYPVVNSFSIQPELYFIQKGTKLAGTGQISIDDGWEYVTYDVEEDLIMQTNYLDLLVLAKYNLSQGKVRPYLVLGPGIGYLLTSKMKVKVTIEDESDSQSEKFEGFKRVDASINLGFGLDFNRKIRLDARYQFGLIPIFQDEYSDGYVIKNGGLAFNLIIVF